MEKEREKYLTEEFNKKQLLEDNLEDMRKIIKMSQNALEAQNYLNYFEINQKEIEIDEKKGTIFAMRDTLIQVFQYLKNIKKLESFMKSKHDNAILVLFKMYTTSDKFTTDLLNSEDYLQEVAYRLGLSDQLEVGGRENE